MSGQKSSVIESLLPAAPALGFPRSYGSSTADKRLLFAALLCA